MQVACLGGGPAGLYFAISMMRRDPSHQITVYERNRPGDTFGWGVVLSDQTLENMTANDPEGARAIEASLAHWDDIDVFFREERVRSSGHGFSGIGRKRLLQVLQDRALELGVRIEFETDIGPDDPRLTGADLIIAADGLNSRVRTSRPEAFGADVEVRANKFVCAGHAKDLRRLHLHFPRDAPRLDLGPRLPVRGGLLDLHHGMFSPDLGGPGLWPDGPGRDMPRGRGSRRVASRPRTGRSGRGRPCARGRRRRRHRPTVPRCRRPREATSCAH